METPHPSGRSFAPVVVVLAGLAIVVLSFVPAWLVHVRNVGGHGLTAVAAQWSAWEGRGVPFLPVAVLMAGLAATLALLRVARPGSVGRAWILAAALTCLAVLLAAALPLTHRGHVSRVELSAGWSLALAIGLAGLMVGGAVHGGRWGARALLVGAGATLVLLAAAVVGRALALELAERNPGHYADGTYVREGTAGQPTETLTIREGSFRVDDRWSGTFTGRGLVVVITDDPACPDARGTYRIFSEGDEDIRWNEIVDVCVEGERAADLTTGIWRRTP